MTARGHRCRKIASEADGVITQHNGETVRFLGSARGRRSGSRVMEPGLQDDEVIAVDEVDEAVFFADAA